MSESELCKAEEWPTLEFACVLSVCLSVCLYYLYNCLFCSIFILTTRNSE